MEKPKLSSRLSTAAEMALAARVGKVDFSAADIGTDHALLPIFLAMSGFSRLLASDIREGPCRAARTNVERYSLTDKIAVACRAGLDRIEDFSPELIMVCGMGGEMIASILEASDYPEKSRCRLILQPQSMQDVLRKSLLTRGFRIEEERVVLDDGKYYQLISAAYSGEPVGTLDPTELKLGRLNLERAEREQNPIDLGWLEFVRESADARLEGMKNAQNPIDTSADQALIGRIDEILKGNANADCK